MEEIERLGHTQIIGPGAPPPPGSASAYPQFDIPLSFLITRAPLQTATWSSCQLGPSHLKHVKYAFAHSKGASHMVLLNHGNNTF